MSFRDGEGDHHSNREDDDPQSTNQPTHDQQSTNQPTHGPQSTNQPTHSSKKTSSSHPAFGATDTELRDKLHTLLDLQREVVMRIRDLEEIVASGAGTANGNKEGEYLSRNSATSRDAAVYLTTEKCVQDEIYAYRRSLENTSLFLDTAMKDLLKRQIRRECAYAQTYSTSITAQDAEAQTGDIIQEDDFFAEKLLFRLPDLEEAIAHLCINMETQTDLQMDHFSPDSQSNLHSSDNVVIIYRNPSMASFLLPYLIRVGGVALGCLALYSLARFTALSLRPVAVRPPISTNSMAVDMPSNL
ncbi:hypothetical protein BV898_03379 [Hypsibius exemplaris]|uniref:Uncharacterized protein n=1 Tax=Hypsibius exemplaris TaxID=2072580 RepID=A0A1W0X516_HYPEX|nr:hypothetical protein BV898_03379 [Hypsibius exemplaris]